MMPAPARKVSLSPPSTPKSLQEAVLALLRRPEDASGPAIAAATGLAMPLA
jgi:hypothetical protein